jgi:hypothetical protein
MRNFDHGYALTSHSSQGFTEIRVIANIDTEVIAQPHQHPARHLASVR